MHVNHRFATSLIFSSHVLNQSFVVTNVYAPINQTLKKEFLLELKAIKQDDDMPWLIVGDFNLLRFANEKNNANFMHNEADTFNQTLDDLALLELPLLDHRFTWSNNCQNPTLERIDRAFFNLAWNTTFPLTTLSSLTRYTSDHVPLMIQVNTSTPRSLPFHFESAWAFSPACSKIIQRCWASTRRAAPTLCLAHALTQALKSSLATLKKWAAMQTPAPLHLSYSKSISNFLDLKKKTYHFHAPNSK